MTPRHNTAEAVAFLLRFHAGQSITLVSIPPDGSPRARTFAPDEVDELSEWIEKIQGSANIYFHVARLLPNVHHVKASKAELLDTGWLHVDIDDPESLDRIKACVPSPTLILFSGGGYQAFFKLDQPTRDFAAVESANRALAKRIGGDHVYNADRIMRVPGTVNVPNAKKRANGRTPALARLVVADWDKSVRLADFGNNPPPLTANVAMPPVLTEVAGLPETLNPDLLVIIKEGDDPTRPRGSEAARYPSRSEAVFYVTCELARAGCSEELIAGVLLNPALGISASILEKRNAVAYARRQARSAHAAVSNGWPDADKGGHPRSTMRNAMVAIQRLGVSCSYDIFRHRKVIDGHELDDHRGELNDDACMVMRGLILERFGFDPRSEHVRDAVNLLCLSSAFHPVRQMLDGLVWDGKPRLDRWLITYLGAEDTELNRAYSRIVLIAAVRRIRHPGTKFDQILVLEGPQGSGKSTALSILAGPGNHSDQEILTADAKTQMELLEGVWIYELGEIEGFNKAEVNRIKAFASRTIDRSRMAYAQFAVARPRQVIFIGTTNEDKYLRDETGNRRFWPVLTTYIDLDALRQDRDQLLAEAAHREWKDEPITLPSSLWHDAWVQQAQRLEEDPWLDFLANEPGREHGDVVRAGTIELLDRLNIPRDRQTQAHTKRLSTLMKKLGWQPAKYRDGDATVRGYERPKPEGHKDKPRF